MHEKGYLHNDIQTINCLYNSTTQKIKIQSFGKVIKVVENEYANFVPISPDRNDKVS